MAVSRSSRAKRFAGLLGASTVLTTLALPMAAMAQEAPAPAEAPQPAADSGGLTEIVVTATRKSESIQKVAISLQALDPATLEQHQVSSFADYANLLPSVSFETLGPGRSQPFFRGISVSGGQASTVGVYLDDMPITAPDRNPELHIYDVERVEALSGPQGTLFGASSLAGTLRIITNKPKFDKVEAGIDVQANKWGKGSAGGQVEGFVNVPLSEKAAIRLMGFYDKTGGYIDNVPAVYNYESVPYTINNSAIAKKDYNTNEEWGGRAQLALKPSDDWTITPGITYQGLNSKGAYNFDPKFGDLVVHDFSPTWLKDDWYQASLTIQGKIGDFDIVSATGYFNRKIKNSNDYTYYSVTYDKLAAADPGYIEYTNFKDKNGNFINPTQQYYGEIKQRKFTQEVRLSVPKDWPFDLTIGGFYQFQKSISDVNYFIPGLSQATNIYGFSPALPGAINPDSFYLVEQDRHFKDGAAFAEGSWEFVKNVKITGGIRRYVSDTGNIGFAGIWRSAKNTTTAHQADGTPGCWNSDPAVIYNKFIHPSRLSCINTGNQNSHDVGETHKVSLSWQATPDKMIYTTYSTGFRPGGGNRLAGSSPYKPDTLTNFELGWKTRWGSNFRWNAAVYYEKWKGVQYVVIPPGFQGAGVVVNAGDARVYGIETDLEWRPYEGLTLTASGALNDAKLANNFCALVSRADLSVRPSCSDATGDIAAPKGTRLPRQPIFKGSATARYTFDLGGKESFVQGSVFHQSGSTSDLDLSNNALLGNTAGFTSFDFSAGTKFENIAIEAFIQNAFDRRGILSKNTFCSIEFCSGSARSYPIKPQFFGIKASWRY
ncbi:TonB-dependent receptor [Novosphingobium sp.]|uniref:TonB-dependent receptor n=1 Tax=Novosphingobium sp. TaxID=1874826 RepID=UPI0038B9AB04